MLAIVALAAVLRWGTPTPGWALDWLHLDPAVTHLVVDPVLRLAAVLARFDDGVIDRGVSGATGGTVRVADGAERIEQRGIDAAVDAVAQAVRRSARQARRPQTGQLYQYYLQVVLLLLAAALLLIVVS